jgi:hypothetical protein
MKAVVLLLALAGGAALWAGLTRPGAPEAAAACSSCDARHQHLSRPRPETSP